MNIHVLLWWPEVDAFDFSRDDFDEFRQHVPGAKLWFHVDAASFLRDAGNADYVLAWHFPADWYAACPSLQAVFTPAAGSEWVEPDPSGRVRVVHGSFHGPLIAESLLSAILFMNHQMPAMIRNFALRAWDRNLQRNARLLRTQTVMVVGLGHIGSHCANLISRTGARVLGFKRDVTRLPIALEGVEVIPASDLDEFLPQADHVALVLPGDESTDGLMSETRLRRCKPGAYIYNFGRGNAVSSDALCHVANHIGGAFLDVVDEEPLSPNSALWRLPNVMITPHSSCVYQDYKRLFLAEVLESINASA
ncbi:MAG: NAD(P)-dependent oxidoreductase [Pseudomonadota bacterium]